MNKPDDKKPNNVFRGTLFKKEQKPRLKRTQRNEKKEKSKVSPRRTAECCNNVDQDYKLTLSDKYTKFSSLKDRDLLSNVEY